MSKYNILHHSTMNGNAFVNNCDQSRPSDANFTFFANYDQFSPIMSIFGMFLTSYQILMTSIILSGSKLVGIGVYLDFKLPLKIFVILKPKMTKNVQFGHFLHFCELTYERDRVQRVKICGLQPEFAFHQIVSQKIKIRPYYKHQTKPITKPTQTNRTKEIKSKVIHRRNKEDEKE